MVHAHLGVTTSVTIQRLPTQLIEATNYDERLL
jgi:hypothetical protein